MASFNEYRDKWEYKCPACGSETYSYRDCGDTTPCRCGQDMRLVNFTEGKHIEYEPANTAPAVHTFKPYFDVTMGKEVTSKKEIEEYCKKHDMVYAGDAELTQQCKQNKREREQKFNKQFSEGLKQELLRKLN